jgi:hypothetical protein
VGHFCRVVDVRRRRFGGSAMSRRMPLQDACLRGPSPVFPRNSASTISWGFTIAPFVGTIVEGPASWKVRPVAEIFYENEFGKAQTVSGLLGLIWQVNDKLAFDVGIRTARTNGHTVNEIRAGLTVGFDLAPRLSAPHH